MASRSNCVLRLRLSSKAPRLVCVSKSVSSGVPPSARRDDATALLLHPPEAIVTRPQAWREGAQVHLQSRGRNSFSSSLLLDAKLLVGDDGLAVSKTPRLLPAMPHSIRCLVLVQGVTVFPGKCGDYIPARDGGC
jgi:hypothetical protein